MITLRRVPTSPAELDLPAWAFYVLAITMLASAWYLL